MARRRKRPAFLKKTKRAINFFILLILIGAMAVLVTAFARGYIEEHPQDFPWTELNLTDPVGYFSGGKLAGLQDDYALCQRLLNEAGLEYRPFPSLGEGQCVRDDNISILGGGAGQISYLPKTIAPSCPVVAAMTIWEDQVVQPAALELLGQRVVGIRHMGSYNCRKIAGSDHWSEHATGNAIDIAAFVMEDGMTVSLSGNWAANDASARFLRKVRDGSCDLFATVLSPDYNSAHADHFHLDQASRGATGFRMCR